MNRGTWLTCSGWLTHISGHPSAAGRAQDRESSPVNDRHSATVPRHQPIGLSTAEVTGAGRLVVLQYTAQHRQSTVYGTRYGFQDPTNQRRQGLVLPMSL